MSHKMSKFPDSLNQKNGTVAKSKSQEISKKITIILGDLLIDYDRNQRPKGHKGNHLSERRDHKTINHLWLRDRHCSPLRFIIRVYWIKKQRKCNKFENNCIAFMYCTLGFSEPEAVITSNLEIRSMGPISELDMVCLSLTSQTIFVAIVLYIIYFEQKCLKLN